MSNVEDKFAALSARLAAARQAEREKKNAVAKAKVKVAVVAKSRRLAFKLSDSQAVWEANEAARALAQAQHELSWSVEGLVLRVQHQACTCGNKSVVVLGHYSVQRHSEVKTVQRLKAITAAEFSRLRASGYEVGKSVANGIVTDGCDVCIDTRSELEDLCTVLNEAAAPTLDPQLNLRFPE